MNSIANPAVSLRPLALDLYESLMALDPARFQAQTVEALKLRFSDLQQRFKEASISLQPRMPSVSKNLGDLSEVIENEMPQSDDKSKWMRFRNHLQESYLGLSDSLREAAISIPDIRITNAGRTVLHVAIAMFGLAAVFSFHWIPWLKYSWLGWTAGIATLVVWTLQIASFQSRRTKRFLHETMGLGKLAHRHEVDRINSATYFTTSLFVLSLLGPLSAIVGLSALGFGDPAAGIIGRRFGSTKITKTKSLQGTTAFILAGSVAAILFLLLEGTLSPFMTLWLSVVGVTAAAVAELAGSKIDDNLTVPIVASFVTYALLSIT